jgi:RimJ/RimL family protein N-acetyltransferase
LEKLGFVPDRDYREEVLARGSLVWCHRMALNRENFGRKRSGRLQRELVEA